MDFLNAQRVGDGFGGGLRVAGSHDDAQTGSAQCVERRKRCGLDRVSDGHGTGETSIHRQEHHAGTLLPQAFRTSQQGRNVGADLGHEGLVAERQRLCAHASAYAHAGDGVEVVGAIQR